MKRKFLQLLLLGMFAFMTSTAFAQIKVSGVVKSSDGGFLPGATVVVKGTTKGATVTDSDGKYNIAVPNAQSTLVFTFIGMATQEIPVNGKAVVNATLTTVTVNFDEVVVTALGISREKKSLGYSVGEVKGEELQKVATDNVLNSLAGKVSGVAISSTGGMGSSVSMVIRGASSLTSDNQPLFVVDGVPMSNTVNNVSQIGNDNRVDYGNAISDINPDDIESLSVLKGPSAAALYGSRAGNGVVLITTKSGKKKKGLGVTITSNTVIDSPYKYLDNLLNNGFAYGQRPFTQDNRPSNNMDYISIDPTETNWAGPQLNKGMLAYQWPYYDASGKLTATALVDHTNNAKNFFQTGYTTTNNIEVADATDRVDYRISYNNMEGKGLIPNDDLHKNSISLNSTVKMTSKLKINSNFNFSSTGAKNRPAGNRGTNPMQAFYQINPSIDILSMKNYWKPGQEGIMQNSPYTLDDPTSYVNNPYFLANEVNNGFQRDRIYGNVKLDYQILPSLAFFARYSLDAYHEFQDTKISKSYTGERKGLYGLINSYRRERNADFLLSYSKKATDFNITASLGGNAMYQFSNYSTIQGKSGGSGLILPGIFNVGNMAPSNIITGSGIGQKGIYSIYALGSVGYKDMAYLDLTARNDWSSTLPVENRSYFYPSASLSLLVNHMFDLGPKVSLLKVRAGWAQVGNDTNPYMLQNSMGNAGSWGDQTQLTTSGTLLLPNLKPEIKTSKEIGLDLGLLENRLKFEGTYYSSENRNQILSTNLTPSTGSSYMQYNAGLISSKGIELSIGGTPIKTNDWTWDLNVIYSKNRSTVEELAPGFTHITLWTDAKGGAMTWVGEQIGNIVDKKYLRVEDKTSPYYGWPLLDGGWDQEDGTLEKNGKRVAPVIGNFNPDFTMGIHTSVRYKDFTLSATIDWRKGGQFVSQTMRYEESDMHGNRILNTFIHVPAGVDMATWLKQNASLFGPNGTAFPVVGGPTAAQGGLPYTDSGITLNDGTFVPGVSGSYDANGKFTMEQEWLTPTGDTSDRYGDMYGWGLTKTATFDADFVKLRDLTLSYKLPSLKSIGIQNAFVSVYTSNVILWTKAKIGIDPEMAFQPENGVTGPGSTQFKQGIERYNATPWTIPVGFKLNVSF